MIGKNTTKKEEVYSEDVSILSSGVNINGKLTSNGNVRIDGKIIGDIDIKGNLTLGISSSINGEVKAKNVTVSGKVEGTLKVEDKLTLESTATVKGDLFAKALIIEEGAKFDGKSSMGQNASSLSTSTSETKK
jgi:cytoskeletal protein CcmA (bactofilin family)